jgi:hypothetical protein
LRIESNVGHTGIDVVPLPTITCSLQLKQLTSRTIQNLPDTRLRAIVATFPIIQ